MILLQKNHFIPLSVHPLFYATISFICGILSCYYETYYLFITMALLLVILNSAYKHSHLFFRLILSFSIVFSFCTGFYRYKMLVNKYQAQSGELVASPFNAVAVVTDYELHKKKDLKQR